MAPLRLLASVLAAVTLAASVPINKDESTFGYGVQNTTYDSEQSVCVVDDVLYRAGDSLASANACERCVCAPPDFVCSPMACPMSPGCRAVQRPGQCCPDYHCECELNGQIYQNGEKVQAAERPCHVCYCRGGYVVCAALECYRRLDCAPRYEPGACCPKYDHCPPLENINRKRPQFPVPTVAGDTDNHIHRTLLLDEDQQLDSTNTDERILRLGEVSGATGKSNTGETDLPQSDEAVKSEEQEVPASTEGSVKIKPTVQKEVTSYKVNEATTEPYSFEMLQTPNYSREVVKDVITDHIQSTSNTVAETPESTVVTIHSNLETITDGSNEDVTDKTTMKLLESEAAADSDKVTQQPRTEPSEGSGSHTTELQTDLDVLGATERNTLPEVNSFVKKSDTKTENKGNLPTVISYRADENLTEDPSISQDTPVASTVEYLTEEAVKLEFQEHGAITTTVQPDNDTVSVGFDNEPRDNVEFTEASNNVKNDIVTEEIEQTSENFYTTQDINSDSYSTESLVHHITQSHDLETEARENLSADKDQFVINSATQKGNEETDITTANEEKLSIIENEKAETQRTSPIITNIRVTDDDEFDGGIITDDDEESTDDNRPPITTDRIIYTYDKHDSSKPTTIEAFAVTDNASVFDEKVSTTVYEKEPSQTTTEMPHELATERKINEKENVAFEAHDQHSAPTTESEELTLNVDPTTSEGITEETSLLPEIYNETVNTSSIINATKQGEMMIKIPDGNANDSEISENSSGSSKLILQETYKKSEDDDIDSLPKSESSVADYDKSNETAENLKVKPQNPTNVQSETQLSETDASDTFIREEPPVLLFKDEMAIHQMDVVVAENEEEEEASGTKEEQTEKVTNVTPQSKIDNVTNDALPSVSTISTPIDDIETKKLLEKGYMTGFLNDQSGLPQKQHNMNAEVRGDVFTTESTIHEESTFNTDSIDLTTTEDISIPELSMESKRTPEERNSAVQMAGDNLLDAEHLKTTTEITTEEIENFTTSVQLIITEKVTEQPKNDIFTTVKINYNETSIQHQSTSHESHLKAITGNNSPSDEAPKILPEVISFRHNVSLSGNQLQQNFSESRQEITTPEAVTLPESWLKNAEVTTEEEVMTILSTTGVTDSPQEFTEATTLNDFSNLATEYFVHAENSKELTNQDEGDGVHVPGREDEGPAQTIKKRNFRSEDSENLDKHDLLVLQEFFRKLYHH